MTAQELDPSVTDLEQVLGRAHALRTLAQALRSPDDLAPLARALNVWRQRSSGALAEALGRAARGLDVGVDGVAAEHDRLLYGRGGVAVREIVYADPRHLAPSELVDVAGFMAAFGLRPLAEPPDHVASQCELASWLALKEAYAAAEGWSERRDIARSAYQQLFAAHLSRWLPRFAARLREATVLELYAGIADVFELFLRAEAERLDVALVDGEPCERAPWLDNELGCAGCPRDAG